MKKPSMQIGLGIALGAGVGTAISIALGSGGAWLALGIAIGVTIGIAMSRTKAGSHSTPSVPSDIRAGSHRWKRFGMTRGFGEPTLARKKPG